MTTWTVDDFYEHTHTTEIYIKQFPIYLATVYCVCVYAMLTLLEITQQERFVVADILLGQHVCV
jgi:hypothetical protein